MTIDERLKKQAIRGRHRSFLQRAEVLLNSNSLHRLNNERSLVLAQVTGATSLPVFSSAQWVIQENTRRTP